jgi:hypothetical protein
VGKIFISYRRADSNQVVGRISDQLRPRFGDYNIFRDYDAIPGAEDFAAAINRAIAEVDLMLVVIGPQWVSATEANGSRRLDNPADYVRLEVEAGLKRGIPVLPVLVSGAMMPSAANIPPSMLGLTRLNAEVVRDDPDFHRDLGKLIATMSRYVQPLAIAAPDAQQTLHPLLYTSASPQANDEALQALTIGLALLIFGLFPVFGLIFGIYTIVTARNALRIAAKMPDGTAKRRWMAMIGLAMGWVAVVEQFGEAVFGIVVLISIIGAHH